MFVGAIAASLRGSGGCGDGPGQEVLEVWFVVWVGLEVVFESLFAVHEVPFAVGEVAFHGLDLFFGVWAGVCF